MTAAYAGHCAAGNSPALQFYSRHHRHHFLAGNRCSGTGIAVLCMHHHSATETRWRQGANHRPGCRGMEDQCHLHRHYDGMPADSNDPLGDIMYTLFLRDPYRTLEFYVPPEMHVDQVV